MNDAEAFVHRYIDDFINGGNVALVDELFTPDVTFRDPLFPGGSVHGIDQLKQVLGALGGSMRDLHFTPEHVVSTSAGDVAGWHGVLQATLIGDEGAVGRRLNIPLAEFYRLEGGKIADVWVYLDMEEFKNQTGMVQAQG
jgi:hypothetical protein